LLSELPALKLIDVMKKPPFDFSTYERALQSLRAALTPPPANDRERDGAIQRFEYTFEISWKFAKKVLLLNGINSQSPREVIRELAAIGWIAQPELWFEFLEARNMTSHNYREDVALNVFSKVSLFAAEAEQLLTQLKANAKD
jgi:hypothetical protein